ncbi:MAG: hypothetical protein Q8R91_04095 [Candidatus Omnitrophota bacterium]|nr:hypothetical protein [Candidatus Omnitrophota bacterium]
MPRRRTLIPRIIKAWLCVSVVALAVAVTVPHRHDQSPFSHRAEQCRACKIQDGFSAAPPRPLVIQLPHLRVAATSLVRAHAPRSTSPVHLPSPRAPPALA